MRIFRKFVFCPFCYSVCLWFRRRSLLVPLSCSPVLSRTVEPTTGFRHTEKELQELAEQINAIDAKRVDNHFTVNGKIPAGQAVLSDLLANCYALLEGLRVQSKSD
eukprot:TRINITY_DN669_c0_g1_i2.p3 TRINITY_DN669_c0_g1~~TRINITY_DN669_c0_g1_i2.p3  ORF type:complete len:106 (-),score=7.09 TRINITY_DN669_c0_g1_i2:262-579(-)